MPRGSETYGAEERGKRNQNLFEDQKIDFKHFVINLKIIASETSNVQQIKSVKCYILFKMFDFVFIHFENK